MEWKTEDILRVVVGGGFFTLLSTIVARAMGWIRFGKTDKAKIGKVEAETAIDLATATQKKIETEVKISDAALQWTVNLASQLEKANTMNDRLNGIIDAMRRDFDKEVKKLKEDFAKRINELEEEVKRYKNELIKEREAYHEEVKKLKEQNGSR